LNVQPRRNSFIDADPSVFPERGLRGADYGPALTACPCCRQAVAVPPLETVIAERGIKGHAAAVLETVWNCGGFPVVSEQLFDAMYADDPDGGPSTIEWLFTLSSVLQIFRKDFLVAYPKWAMQTRSPATDRATSR
jgi:hypothetical protein